MLSYKYGVEIPPLPVSISATVKTKRQLHILTTALILIKSHSLVLEVYCISQRWFMQDGWPSPDGSAEVGRAGCIAVSRLLA
jgi:hypothetical protein